MEANKVDEKNSTSNKKFYIFQLDTTVVCSGNGWLVLLTLPFIFHWDFCIFFLLVFSFITTAFVWRLAKQTVLFQQVTDSCMCIRMWLYGSRGWGWVCMRRMLDNNKQLSHQSNYKQHTIFTHIVNIYGIWFDGRILSVYSVIWASEPRDGDDDEKEREKTK